MKPIELEATHLRGNRYAVRPKGSLGTCGWSPFPWTVVYVTARSEDAAVKKARGELERQAEGHRKSTQDDMSKELQELRSLAGLPVNEDDFQEDFLLPPKNAYKNEKNRDEELDEFVDDNDDFGDNDDGDMEPVHYKGEVVGYVWPDGYGTWAEQSTLTGGSWDMVDTKEGAIRHLLDIAQEEEGRESFEETSNLGPEHIDNEELEEKTDDEDEDKMVDVGDAEDYEDYDFDKEFEKMLGGNGMYEMNELRKLAGLEPISEKKASKDWDGDGKIESDEEEWKGVRDKAIKKAEAKEKGKKVKESRMGELDAELEDRVRRAMERYGVPLRHLDAVKQDVIDAYDDNPEELADLSDRDILPILGPISEDEGNEMPEKAVFVFNDDSAYHMLADELGPELEFGPAEEILVPAVDADRMIGFLSNQGFNDGEDFEVKYAGMDEDLQNGYKDRKFSDGQDYFPKSFTGSVAKDVGPSAARMGSNPMSQRMNEDTRDLYETYKGRYANFVKESMPNPRDPYTPDTKMPHVGDTVVYKDLEGPNVVGAGHTRIHGKEGKVLNTSLHLKKAGLVRVLFKGRKNASKVRADMLTVVGQGKRA